MEIFNSSLLSRLQYAMDVSSYKNSVIAQNIANIDTPGYKSKGVDFNKSMEEIFSSKKKIALMKTDDKHIDGSKSSENFFFLENRNSPSMRNDGNDVNIDLEMYEMSSNGILYSELSQITGYQFTKIKTAITGR